MRASESQELLIRQYCREADELLASAPDLASAIHGKEELCTRFQKECASRMVVDAVRRYFEGVIRKRWGAETPDEDGTEE